MKHTKFINALSLLARSHRTKFTSELKFHPKRKWRFDFALPEKLIAVEIEGGIFSGGRHTRGTGFINDMEKYNEAQKLGWRVLRYSPQQSAKCIDDVWTILNEEQKK